MRGTTRHVSDGELLLLDEDGALPARRRSAVSRHVAACPRCSARRTDLGAALAEAAVSCRAAPGGASPPHIARARLRSAIDAPPRWSFAGRLPAVWPPAAWAPRPLAAALAAAAAAVLAWSIAGGPSAPAPPAPQDGAAARLDRPRHDLTPGRVLPVGVDEICGRRVPVAPAVAAPVPRQVFEAYGVDYRRAAEYELDFLITPELGGAPDPRNLWPQPYRAGVWNAYVKDELERELQDLVCRGALDLATAQRELADDWIAAYKRRFDTDRPLRDYGRLPLTPAGAGGDRSERAERRLRPEGGPRPGAGPPIAARTAPGAAGRAPGAGPPVGAPGQRPSAS